MVSNPSLVVYSLSIEGSMKTHLLYIIIGILLAGNVALLLKKTPFRLSPPRKREETKSPLTG